MDVWVNFANATKWQAKGIFKCFFPYKPSSESTQDESVSATTEQNLPLPRRKSAIPTIPLLSEDELNDLAERFSAAIPEDELSVCALRCKPFITL
jgi:mitochondrial chaperone BCS1